MRFLCKKMLNRIAFIWCLAAFLWEVEARNFHRLNKAIGVVKKGELFRFHCPRSEKLRIFNQNIDFYLFLTVSSNHNFKPYDHKKDHEKKHVGATNRLSTILQKLNNKQTSIGKGAAVLGDVLKTVGKGIDGLGKKKLQFPAVLKASLKLDSASMLKRMKSKNVSKSFKKKINLNIH